MQDSCVIITAHNRVKVTSKFINSLSYANSEKKIIKYLSIIDTSHNGRNQVFKKEIYSFEVIYLYLGPNYWWCSAMKNGISWLINFIGSDFRIILANDDMVINKNAFDEFIRNLRYSNQKDILVGSVGREFSNIRKTVYGIRIVQNRLFMPKFMLHLPQEKDEIFLRNKRITFNANWVSIHTKLYKKIGGLYNYNHAFGDYELGLKALDNGAQIKYGCNLNIGKCIISEKEDIINQKNHKFLNKGRNAPLERSIFLKRNFGRWYYFCSLLREFFK